MDTQEPYPVIVGCRGREGECGATGPGYCRDGGRGRAGKDHVRDDSTATLPNAHLYPDRTWGIAIEPGWGCSCSNTPLYVHMYKDRDAAIDFSLGLARWSAAAVRLAHGVSEAFQTTVWCWTCPSWRVDWSTGSVIKMEQPITPEPVRALRDNTSSVDVGTKPIAQ